MKITKVKKEKKGKKRKRKTTRKKENIRKKVNKGEGKPSHHREYRSVLINT